MSIDMGSTDVERKAFVRGWGAGFSAASSVDEPVDRARLAWAIYMAEFDELVKDGQDLTFDAAADLIAATYDSTTEVPVDWYQLRNGRARLSEQDA